jgi:SAM-dependent methyltransferase
VTPEKPFSPACERNQQAIFDVLTRYFPGRTQVLEIGSGTGQHGVFFNAQHPEWVWQCSDLPQNLPGIGLWLEDAPHLPAALAWDLCSESGPNTAKTPEYDAVFTANTLHIMPWSAVEQLFLKLAAVLRPGGRFAAYGPFNYNGQFTSPSNAEFDLWLKSRAAHQGIRDFAAIKALADQANLALLADQAMPANNRLLIWQRSV